MATNYTNVMPILGVNLEGNEQAPTGELITPAGGAPRLPLKTPTLISLNRVAIYCIAAGPISVGATITVDADGTARTVATTSSGNFISMSVATTSTSDYMWAAQLNNLAR